MTENFQISAPVGESASNHPDDLRLIQMLLNRVPQSQGGPNPKINADGLIGPKTIAAIVAFQQHHQLPVADGRIDPGGRTMRTLNEVLNRPPEGLVPVAGLPDPLIPLAPGIGGRSIGLSALQPGDIIVGSFDTQVGAVIRAVTSSTVSHVMVYLGPDEFNAERVAEAVAIKLRYGYLTTANGGHLSQDNDQHALKDASLAVAFRHQPGLTGEQVRALKSFAGDHIGELYSLTGIILNPRYSVDLRSWCEKLGVPPAEVATIVEHAITSFDGTTFPFPIDAIDALLDKLAGMVSDTSRAIARQCLQWVGQVQLSLESDRNMFCSEFVLKAYQSIGLPLTDIPPNWSTPQDIVELDWNGRLGYVGHLIG